jgi:hypothetical protein
VGFLPFQPAASSGSGAVLVKPSGTNDTAAINAVIGAGQMVSLVSGGAYNVGNLVAASYGGIYGNNAIMTALPGTTGYIFALKTPATTKQVVIRDLTINCNQVCGGIQLDNTGFTPIIQFTPYDPMHTLDNILVLAALGDAYHFDNNAREIRVENCKQYFASGYGFYRGPGAASNGAGCTDSHFTDCTSGPSGNHGWYEASGSGNNMHVSSKGFFSGFSEAAGTWGTTENAFEILSTNSVYDACSAQQAALHGFDLNNAAQVSVSNCEADTNSAGAGVTTGVGVNVNASANCTVAHVVGSNNGSISPGAQAYGIQVAGNITGTTIYGNTVTGPDGPFNYVSGFGDQLISAEVTSLNGVTLLQEPAPNLYEYGTVQALVTGSTIDNGATTIGTNYALYPVSSTAAVTGLILQVPANGDGTQITVINTTAFTLTFAAAATSHVADGVSDVIPALSSRTFTYYGTAALWYRTA